MKKIITGILFTAALAMVLAGCGTPQQGATSGELDTFAQCLSDNGATMYGAYWCPHCQTQKDMFEGSFDKVNYVECSLPNRQGMTQACKMAGIETYPTWEFADGTRRTGVLQLQTLSNLTGCELPQ